MINEKELNDLINRGIVPEGHYPKDPRRVWELLEAMKYRRLREYEIIELGELFNSS